MFIWESQHINAFYKTTGLGEITKELPQMGEEGPESQVTPMHLGWGYGVGGPVKGTGKLWP